MRVFPRLARFACFAALGTGLIMSAVWCWVHACFPALSEVRMFCRPWYRLNIVSGLVLGACVFSCVLWGSHVFPPLHRFDVVVWFGARCVRTLNFFHFPHVITFFLVCKQRIYAAPSGNDLVWELILSKNMVGIPLFNRSGNTVYVSSFVPGGFFERYLWRDITKRYRQWHRATLSGRGWTVFCVPFKGQNHRRPVLQL